jgi:hypothetical protein
MEISDPDIVDYEVIPHKFQSHDECYVVIFPFGPKDFVDAEDRFRINSSVVGSFSSSSRGREMFKLGGI